MCCYRADTIMCCLGGQRATLDYLTMRARLFLLIPLLFTFGCDDIAKALEDSDTDGDGDPDELDCAPEDPNNGRFNDEDCTDGVDNDCDDLVDGDDPDCMTEDPGDSGTTDTGGDTGDPDVWPPAPPTVGYAENLGGDSTTLTDFVMYSGLYDSSDLILGDPLWALNTGRVASWNYATVSTGGIRGVSDADWVIEGDSSSYFGFSVHANPTWVVVTGLASSTGDAEFGSVYVFDRATLDSTGGTFTPADAIFTLDGVAVSSFGKGLWLDGDILHAGDSNGDGSGTGRTFEIDLSDPTLTSGLINTSGTLFMDQGLPASEWPNYQFRNCVEPTTGNITWFSSTPRGDTVSWYLQASGSSTRTHIGDLQVSGSTLDLGMDLDCWDDYDGDGYADILASGDGIDVTLLIPTAFTVTSDIQTWVHYRWQQDPPPAYEKAGESFVIVNDYDGQRWFGVGAASARDPDGARTGVFYLVSEDNLQSLPSDHTHAGGLAAAPVQAIYGSYAGGQFGDRLLDVGSDLVVSYGGANSTIVAPMSEWLSSAPLGPPPPTSQMSNSALARIEAQKILEQRLGLGTPSASSPTGEFTLEFRPSAR